MRLFELARQLGVSSKRLLDEGRRLELGLNNHMNTITDEQTRVLSEAATGDPSAAAAAAPKPSKRRLAQAHHTTKRRSKPAPEAPVETKRKTIEPKKPEVPTSGPKFRPILPPRPVQLDSIESLRRAIAEGAPKEPDPEPKKKRVRKSAEPKAEETPEAPEAPKAEPEEPKAEETPADSAPESIPEPAPAETTPEPEAPQAVQDKPAENADGSAVDAGKSARKAKLQDEPEEGQSPRRGRRRRSRRAREEDDTVDPETIVRKPALPPAAPAGRRPVPIASRQGQRRRGRRRRVRGPIRVQKPLGPKEREFTVRLPVTIKDLSQQLGIRANLIMGRLMQNEIMVTINQSLPPEVVELVGDAFDLVIEVKEAASAEDKLMAQIEEQAEATSEATELRPPIVTFMGHVDHGKTSLLDHIRQTNVVAGESGGITQHIGAYQVAVRDTKVTFLDTPGHEAFTAMRARGANVTDIVVLVVAADDGVMPQTIEAIDHARAADVPIVVAVNKIDLPNANPDRVRAELAERNLVTEEWGGDTVLVNVSAATGEGIDNLLEMLAIVAELQELKGNPDAPARGTALEARVAAGQGTAVTLLVRDGTLHTGDIVLAGPAFGRVKAMRDDRGQEVHEALPSMPVEVLGLSEAPDAGETFVVAESLQEAREVAETRAERERQRDLAVPDHVTLESLFSSIESGKAKELLLVLKADVQGSVEALTDIVERLPQSKVRLRVLRSSVGHVAESDVLLADASDAVIVGLHVGINPPARQLAESRGVDIKLYDVIYHAEKDIHDALEGLLDPIEKEVVTGHAEVRQVIRISRYGGNVAGCYMTDGVIARGARLRIMRDQGIVHTCAIESLRRVKDDVREVREGFECGIRLAGYDDIKEGDILEAFVIERTAAKLEGQEAQE